MAHDLRAIALTSRRLELKSFSPADAPDSFAVTTSTLTRYMGWLPSTSPEAFAEVWREWLLQMKAGTDVYLVIRLKVTGDFLGMVGLHGIGPPPTIGIWVKEAAHGLGYGREAVAAAIGWASGQVGANDFIYPVAALNLPSRRLAESLGGVIAGNNKIRRQDGAFLEEVVYRIPGIMAVR
jgi:RimJ/RimL family protein N-acetyltransferase